MRAPINQMLFKESFTYAVGSPKGWSVGSYVEVAPVCSAPLDKASASST